jgi:DNA-binding transcriptional ArsR family regulator
MLESIFDLQAALCQTMSNANRLRIVRALRGGPRCVASIADDTKLTPSKVSQHLAVLRSRGIVAGTRRGSEIIYQIANPKIEHICDLMREVLAEQAAVRSEMLILLGRSR